MISRRSLLRSTLSGALSLLVAQNAKPDMSVQTYTSQRPKLPDRKFTSAAVESYISEIQMHISDPKTSWIFGNCFPNTLDTTVKFRENAGANSAPDTFVITGDIPAMWLRDSAAQVWPYLPLTKKDDRLKKLIAGVINRQTKCILLDPYANAFLENPTDSSPWSSDSTIMKPGIWERKWEIDSLCYPVRLAYGYWKTTHDTSPFTDAWEQAMDTIVQTFRDQQRKTGHGPYYFARGQKLDPTLDSSYGVPGNPVGLIFSAFRQDDPTTYPLLITSNMFAVLALRQISEMLQKIRHKPAKANAASDLAQEVRTALDAYAVQTDPKGRKIWAYEIDGFGKVNLMDDANVPSLLSLPYLGVCSANDPVYQATRQFVWSADNPWFWQGKYSGIGSVHTGGDTIWPMSIIMFGLTSQSKSEVAWAINELVSTTAGTGFMHESFAKDDPTRYSRSWFAWANTLFGEFIAQTVRRYPDVLQ